MKKVNETYQEGAYRIEINRVLDNEDIDVMGIVVLKRVGPDTEILYQETGTVNGRDEMIQKAGEAAEKLPHESDSERHVQKFTIKRAVERLIKQ